MSVVMVVEVGVVLALALAAASVMAAEYSVVDYGAGGREGGRDGAFLAAWAAACGDGGERPVMRVPAGTFLVGRAYFRGPCRSAGGVVLAIDGTVVAPPAVGNASWITFHYAHGLAIRGGTLDGNRAPPSGRARPPPAAAALPAPQ